MIDLMTLLFNNIYNELERALLMIPMFDIDFVFGTSLLNLAQLISGIIMFAIFVFVVWYPVKLVISIFRAVKRMI